MTAIIVIPLGIIAFAFILLWVLKDNIKNTIEGSQLQKVECVLKNSEWKKKMVIKEKLCLYCKSVIYRKEAKFCPYCGSKKIVQFSQ